MEQTIIHTSIWSNKYQLKRNHISENTLNSSIKVEKESYIQRNSLKNENIPLKLCNNSTIQCDKFSEYEDLNKNAILDIYNSNQNTKPILSPEKRERSEYLSLSKNNVSPELFKEKNPFTKKVSDLATSPSVLANENCRKRGRNLMRIKRTIIDENIIVQSKYFLKHNEKHDVLKSESDIEDSNLKNTKYNVCSTADINICISMKQQKSQDLKTFSTIENTNLTSKVIDNTPPSDLNKSLTDSYENISGKTYFNNKMIKISPTRHFTTINDDCISNNLLVSNFNVRSMSDLISCENTTSLQNDLSKWSNTKNSSFSYKETLKEKTSTSTNLVSI
jgi:hypothetical protein